MSTATAVPSSVMPDPLTVSKDPGLPALQRLYWPMSRERRLLNQCHDLLNDFDPKPPAYCWWHTARMAKTFAILRQRLGPSGQWLDVSSDAWFYLLAKSLHPDWKITPTCYSNEEVEFRSKTTAVQHTFVPIELKIGADTARFIPNDETFDIVTAFEVLEHLSFHPASFLSCVNRALVKGGQFILSTPNGGSWPVINRLLEGQSGQQTYRFGGDMCHRCEYTVYEVKTLLRSAGFQVERIVTANVYPTDLQGWYVKFLRLVHLAGDAISVHLVRLRNLWLLSGSTQFVIARKVGTCDPSQVIRV